MAHGTFILRLGESCLMTMACGITNSFQGLFQARIGVGVGEAALVPAAVSLLADLFDPHERALPMSILTGGVSIGAGIRRRDHRVCRQRCT